MKKISTLPLYHNTVDLWNVFIVISKTYISTGNSKANLNGIYWGIRWPSSSSILQNKEHLGTVFGVIKQMMDGGLMIRKSLLLMLWSTFSNSIAPLNPPMIATPDKIYHMWSHDIENSSCRRMEWLSQLFTEEEVRLAIFDMNGWKSLGLDGIPTIFYHNLWDVIGSDVTKAILETFHSGRLLKQINHTFVYLIPKIANPYSFSQYRSISLYNVIYEGRPKCITNHLNKTMPSLIRPFQNAFVPSRLIGDRCLLIHELLNFIKHKRNLRGLALV